MVGGVAAAAATSVVVRPSFPRVIPSTCYDPKSELGAVSSRHVGEGNKPRGNCEAALCLSANGSIGKRRALKDGSEDAQKTKGIGTGEHRHALHCSNNATWQSRAYETRQLRRQSSRRTTITRAQQTDVILESSITDEEKAKALIEVKQKLAVEHPELPIGEYGRDDEDLLTWFLRDRKYDVDAAVVKLAKMIKWRREFGVSAVTEQSVARMAATGKAYLHSHSDIQGRPVVIVSAAKHFPVREDLEESEKLCVFLIEKAIASLPPGEEKILGIFNLRGFKSKNADLAFVKFIIDIFFLYYPKRLGQVLFVDAPSIFLPGWKIVKPWLKSYAALVRFCSSKEAAAEYFTPTTIPEDLQTETNPSA